MEPAPHTIAIVGRPNVGKSALFNRIIGERVSIVDDQPGVTRDVIARVFEWNGVSVRYLDTGGYEFRGKGEIETHIRRHIEESIQLADALILVVDVTTGPTAEDEEALRMIRQSNRPFVVAANKTDNQKREEEDFTEFYKWGIENMVPVSAVSGRGTGDLLDQVVSILPERPAEFGFGSQEELIRVSIVGRPNVGKSTLLNCLVGADRALVSSIPGTTRDPVDTLIEKNGRRFVLIDTAGIRRPGKIRHLEKYAVARARLAIERSELTLLLIDAEEGVTETDAHVFGMTEEAGRAAILLVNKWDLVEKETGTAGRFVKEIHEKCKFLRHCPIQFISAKTGQRTDRIWSDIERVYQSYCKRIPTSELNDRLEEWVARRPPHGVRGRHPKLLYMAQVASKPPSFTLFVKNRQALHFSYERYLVNQLRGEFGFEGAPIRLWIRESPRREFVEKTSLPRKGLSA